ncbi:MAG: cyclic nucleotide-binding domain-containing protein [Acidobacteria bacterium]|nr:cyclic nucleotide-binding domain-containing protein [Acidobacteriota bacterium]
MGTKADKFLANARAFMAKRNFDKAIKSYQSYLELNPDDNRIRYLLADAYSFNGEEKTAIGIYLDVAQVLRDTGFTMKAMAVCKRVLALEFDNPIAKEMLSGLHENSQVGGRISGLSTPPTSEDIKKGAKIELMPDVDLSKQIDNSYSLDQAIESLRGDVYTEEDIENASAELAAQQAVPVQTAPVPTAPAQVPQAATPVPAQAPAMAQQAAPGVIPKETTKELPILKAKDLLFNDLTLQEYLQLLDRMDIRVFRPGELIVQEGAEGDSMFIICSGEVLVKTADKGGKQIDLATLDEGEFFGEVSLLTGKPRTATIFSKNVTELLELKRDVMPEIENKHPNIRKKLENFYHRRTLHTIETMIEAQMATE